MRRLPHFPSTRHPARPVCFGGQHSTTRSTAPLRDPYPTITPIFVPRIMLRQPPIEAAVGAPLQIEERADATVVGIRTRDGAWRELKRIRE